MKKNCLTHCFILFLCGSGISDGYFQAADTNFYKYHGTLTRSFDDAVAKCMEENAVLVMEDSTTIRKTMHALYPEIGLQLWVGARRDPTLPSGPDGIEDFRWLNTDTWEDDGGTAATGTNCLSVYAASPVVYAAEDCSTPLPFFCQIRGKKINSLGFCNILCGMGIQNLLKVFPPYHWHPC